MSEALYFHFITDYRSVWTCLFCLLLQGVHNILICLIDHYPSSHQIVYFLIVPQTVSVKNVVFLMKKLFPFYVLSFFPNNYMEQETCFSAIISYKTEIFIWVSFGLTSNLKCSVMLVLFQYLQAFICIIIHGIPRLTRGQFSFSKCEFLIWPEITLECFFIYLLYFT